MRLMSQKIIAQISSTIILTNAKRLTILFRLANLTAILTGHKQRSVQDITKRFILTSLTIITKLLQKCYLHPQK